MRSFSRRETNCLPFVGQGPGPQAGCLPRCWLHPSLGLVASLEVQYSAPGIVVLLGLSLQLSEAGVQIASSGQ